jgi:hypothetical protein
LKLKIPLPPKFLDIIYEKIDTNLELVSITNNQRNKVQKVLIELYIYILNKENSDKELNYHINQFVDIHHNELYKFRTQINGKRYKSSFFTSILESSYPAKLIDINHKYSNYVDKKFTKSYRVNTSYLGFDDIEYLDEVEVELDRICDNYRDEKFWVKKYPNYKKLIKSSFKTRVNLHDFWIFMMKNQGMRLRPKLKNNVIVNTHLNYKKTLFNYIKALEINNKKLWFKVSDEGRLYSSLTNLSHLATDYLTIDNRKLFELDVSNCQPLLLNTIVEHKQFKKDTEANLFYKKMGEELKENKETTKILLYRWIFFNLKPVNSGNVYNAFNTLYPGLIEQINELKKEMNLACALQGIESKIFINNIAISMDDVLTKHDAILCPNEKIELVKYKIKEEFKKLSLKSTIKNK